MLHLLQHCFDATWSASTVQSLTALFAAPYPYLCVCAQPDHGYPSRYLGRSRQAGALADLAERCVHEARRVGVPEAEALATEFERVRRQLTGSA